MAMERWLPALGLAIGLSLTGSPSTVAQGQPASGQATPPAARPMVAPGAAIGAPMRPRGEWAQYLHGGGFRAMAPEQMCKERYAREAGLLAYLGAKLDLTGPQQPLWDKYDQEMLEGANKLRQVCFDNARTPKSSLTALERRDRMEKFLTARLDALHATRAPLEALYDSLTPEQRALLDHPPELWPRLGR